LTKLEREIYNLGVGGLIVTRGQSLRSHDGRADREHPPGTLSFRWARPQDDAITREVALTFRVRMLKKKKRKRRAIREDRTPEVAGSHREITLPLTELRKRKIMLRQMHTALR